MIVFAISSCNKDWGKEKDVFKMCELAEVDAVCSDGEFQDYYNIHSDLTKYDVTEIVVDPDCDCIVEGLVKYVRNGKTVALINYGKGECDTWAVKVLCVDGKCDHQDATCCKFEQACGILF